MPDPQNSSQGGMDLNAELWDYSRKNRSAAKDIWLQLKVRSLYLPLSRDALKRLQWFIDCATRFNGNVRRTCRYYGIAPKTFYYWRSRFDISNPRSLEERSRRPKIGKLPVLHPEQTARIFALRSRYPYYSKMKIAALYKRETGEEIASWQVQRVIERYLLYPDVTRAHRIAYKRKHAVRKQRIGRLHMQPWTGWLVSVDTIVLNFMGKKIYILTAIDHHSRLLFARVCKSHSSVAAARFLEELYDFIGSKIQNIHTDNGTEFQGRFQQTARNMGIDHWWSRIRTPKDNAMNERVNRTVQEEFVRMWIECGDFEKFKEALTAWMFEYNHERPHTALGYKTPYEVACSAPNPYPRPDSSFEDYNWEEGRLMTDDEYRMHERMLNGTGSASLLSVA